jgi:hypothetical protein
VNWKIKGLVQKGLSMMPGGGSLNTRLQSLVGGRRDFRSHADGKIADWAQSMQYLAESNFQVSGMRLMEIGTGWFPALPVCFSLGGAESIATFDAVRLLDESMSFRLLDAIEANTAQIAEVLDKSPADLCATLAELRQCESLNDLLGRSRIRYTALADAQATGLVSDSIDLVFSNSVLEHVPREAIGGLMRESFRVLRAGGLAMHNIGCNDHYAFFDRSISFVNFLQYGEREWRLWNNTIQYQNRMRAPEFVELAMQAGFEIVRTATHVRPGTLQALDRMRIAPEFSRFSREEVAATTLDFVCRKPQR